MPRFEGAHQQPDKQSEREEMKQEFFAACRDVKVHLLPQWIPPFHPDKALTASDEEKKAFAASLADAYKRQTGSHFSVGKMGDVLSGDQGELWYRSIIHSLGLYEQYRHTEEPPAHTLLSPQDFASMQAGWARQQREQDRQIESENRMHNDRIDACSALVYADILSSTDLASVYAQEDRNDRQAMNAFASRLDEEIKKRVTAYPIVSYTVSSMDKNLGEGAGNRALFLAMLSRLKKDYPKKEPVKQSFFQKMFGSKETADAMPPQKDWGPELIDAAISALVVDYSTNQYTQIGIKARPITEMVYGLLQNPQAYAYLVKKSVIKDEKPSPEMIRQVASLLHDQLTRRGIQA